MGDNPDAFSASYNPFGQREKKNIGAWANYHEIQFIYDAAGHLIGEYDDLGALIRETVYLGDRPIAVKTPTGLYTIHTDHLDTPRAITDSSGTVVWRWESDAFGVGAVDEDPDGDSNGFTFNLRFPGQYFDRESGLHYNWNRYYDPGTGRYITSDPIGLAGGINTYLYARANPNRSIDPFGLYCLTEMEIAMVAGAAGGAVSGAIATGVATGGNPLAIVVGTVVGAGAGGFAGGAVTAASTQMQAVGIGAGSAAASSGDASVASVAGGFVDVAVTSAAIASGASPMVANTLGGGSGGAASALLAGSSGAVIATTAGIGAAGGLTAGAVYEYLKRNNDCGYECN